jgi:hypothetical protein
MSFYSSIDCFPVDHRCKRGRRPATSYLFTSRGIWTPGGGYPPPILPTSSPVPNSTVPIFGAKIQKSQKTFTNNWRYCFFRRSFILSSVCRVSATEEERGRKQLAFSWVRARGEATAGYTSAVDLFSAVALPRVFVLF